MVKDTADLKGAFVFGSDWRIPIHFGRQKMSTINKARQGNVTRFRQNYLCDWIGASSGALINISKLIKARTITIPELECPKDKRGNLELAEYVISVDVARSSSDSNNKSAIVVLKIIRNAQGIIRQIHLVNIICPPNGLNYKEQALVVKKTFYKYGGNLDVSKSRVKAVVIDANTIGQGLVEALLEDSTDPETNEELGCWATINTDDKPSVPNSPEIIYSLKSQGINGDIIRTFIDNVESNRLKLVKQFSDIKEHLNNNSYEEEIELTSSQTQIFIDEVANLRLKELQKTMTVEQVVKRIDKDRYAATAYGLYYISLFLEKELDESNIDDYLFFMQSGF